MKTILVAVLGLALAVCFAKADVARDASDFGDLLAQCRLSHEIATLQQADGALGVGHLLSGGVLPLPAPAPSERELHA